MWDPLISGTGISPARDLCEAHRVVRTARTVHCPMCKAESVKGMYVLKHKGFHAPHLIINWN